VSKESRRAGRVAARTDGSRAASSGPSGSPRAGRRERPRYIERRSFFERYRTLLVGGVIVAVVAVIAGLIFLQATQPAYACGTIWKPDPTPSPSAGASNRLGYLQPDMGNTHIAVGKSQKYTYCPPASGNHDNTQGVGPISPARIFKPTDTVVPQQWIHNLEHGGLVILYRADSPGATTDGMAKFQQFFDAFPPSPICQVPPHKLSPIIAPFNDMATPFAALVWDRVLPMDTWDPTLALKFYQTESERLDANGDFVAPPETQCPAPSKSASPSESAAPSGSVSPSGSAAPSSAPSASPQPSPSPS
jgi:Protein of unknown function (DUF3105)